MVSLSRRTIAGLITASGRQFLDWTADYRLLSRDRVDPQELLSVVRRGVLTDLPPGNPFIVAMDDTTSRKKGKKIPGTGWRRDSMSPPFRANLTWGRRFIQLSAVVPPQRADVPGRAVPVDLSHAPSAVKPPRAAPPQAWAAYRDAKRKRNLSTQGLERIKVLRMKMAEDGYKDLALWILVDGSYTNQTVLRGLPPGTTLIGRIRGDAKLHNLPEPTESERRGRKQLYGNPVTPEGIRKDPAIPWHTASVYAAGKTHEMRYKTISPILWRTAGPTIPLQLLAIAPLAYRPRGGSRLLYKRPAYLICTDPGLPPHEVLKAYVSRWDIEVNHRDEKQILGLDEAQVRTEASSRNAPILAVAAYAILLLAAVRAFGVNGIPCALPLPKWRRNAPKFRASAADLTNELRSEMWGQAIQFTNFSGFVNTYPSSTNPEKFLPDPSATLFYAQP